MVLRCLSLRSIITFAMCVISPFAFIVLSALQVTSGERSQVVRKLLYFVNSASMTEAVQPLSTSAVMMVVWSDCGFRRLTLISKDDVPGFPCIVTILRSSFRGDTESADIFIGGGGTWDLGGEATSFTPCLWENLLSRPLVSLVLSSLRPLYLAAPQSGPRARRPLL